MHPAVVGGGNKFPHILPTYQAEGTPDLYFGEIHILWGGEVACCNMLPITKCMYKVINIPLCIGNCLHIYRTYTYYTLLQSTSTYVCIHEQYMHIHAYGGETYMLMVEKHTCRSCILHIQQNIYRPHQFLSSIVLGY